MKPLLPGPRGPRRPPPRWLPAAILLAGVLLGAAAARLLLGGGPAPPEPAFRGPSAAARLRDRGGAAPGGMVEAGVATVEMPGDIVPALSMLPPILEGVPETAASLATIAAVTTEPAGAHAYEKEDAEAANATAADAERVARIVERAARRRAKAQHAKARHAKQADEDPDEA